MTVADDADQIAWPEPSTRALLPPLPPLPAWFVQHPQAELHLETCAECRHSRGRLDYDAYLKSPEWAIRRQLALEYYGDRCVLCNSTDRINVHHRTYARLGKEHLRDLIVLCRDCHSRFHRKAA